MKSVGWIPKKTLKNCKCKTLKKYDLFNLTS